MSKHHQTIVFIFVAFATFALSPKAGLAQAIAAEITLDSESQSAVIKGSFQHVERSADAPRVHFSFLKKAIGITDLGLRVSEITLIDGEEEFKAKRLTSTEFVADRPYDSFSYKVDLTPPADVRSAAHTSWLHREHGLLMLDDLLPLPRGKVSDALLILKVPPNWRVLTTERTIREYYHVRDITRAVFVLGKELRDRTDQTDVSIAGTWHFSDAEVGAMADNIFNEYRRIFGGQPMDRPRVVLLPFPQANVASGTWEAETRGSTVLLVSTDTAFKGQSLQRLHEQLRHELFHLWLPNGVNLKGRYDWFYEGFALYQSLKTAVAMNQIRFDDFLDTLSRALNIDRIQPVRRSLIAASNDRWNGAETQLYARGMAVAFLCDIAILRESGGKKSAETAFRQLYSTHKFPASQVDANEAVLKALDSFPGTESIISSYINGDSSIDPDRYLAPAGLENPTGIARISLRVKEKPDGRQKALLDKLGYNNWRKLTRK